MKPISNPEMQPPPSSSGAITPYMRESLARLLQHAESQQLKNAQEQRTDAGPCQLARRDKNANYGALIAQFMASIPPAERQRKYRMDELVAALAGTGRYSDMPASRLIGTALHQAGWTTYRSYKKGSRNARLWCPPPQAD